MVDISKHFSKLNKKLQGSTSFLKVVFAKVKSIEAKLQQWKLPLQNNDTMHLFTLQEKKPSSTAECAKISDAFIEGHKM